MAQPRDISGEIYGNLKALRLVKTYLKYVIPKKHYEHIWLFECKCGKKIEREKSSVMYGNTRSCGCKTAEFIYQTKIKRGYFHNITTHSSGYKTLYCKGKNPYVHRQVMEKELLATGDPSKYQIHHINGNKADNRKENLMIVTPQEHTRLEYGWIKTNNGWNKPCGRCGNIFPVTKEFFYFRSNGRNTSFCKKCLNMIGREWKRKKRANRPS